MDEEDSLISWTIFPGTCICTAILKVHTNTSKSAQEENYTPPCLAVRRFLAPHI